ncbi:alternative ribosome rescue aminoacyl-tRNA hydrolase ArfB [Arthrobacter sp. NEB 688]|uniref:alternative ribosome rescue aminoacyl-tRNA hydrolase ArfB n=1 Tax=Arthrobacter sp. NEB 688 TaxID=904039 RepID=UPI00156533E0|nr:alternative ribosome rescue aminoacyl-tRNA hydrolase ArfB [Arthrobacter sp. NEB 688]QKE86198.1 aminoacyl-tRNA hydrolase [Arthrobacter sp. NEB 688]
MMDLVVPPGPGVPQGLTVPGADLVERFSRASGPGGQGVNTTDSRVELELDLAVLTGLSDAQRRRLARALVARLVEGRLVVTASEHRQQRRNRAAARERMAALLREALAPPPPARRATRPTRGSVERRLDAKRRRALTKAARGRQRPEG